MRERAGGRPVIAVVKAEAYGHGAVAVARRLAREGVDRFAVALCEEGVALRRGGIRGEILVLEGVDPSRVAECFGYGLTPAVHSVEGARALARAAAGSRAPLPVHVKLDTGMRRLGAPRESVPALAAALRASRELAVAGVFTQLSSGESESSEPTARELALLREGLAALERSGIAPGTVHAANSGALLAHADALLDAVRPGLALYGVLPAEGLANPGLRPALALETRVLAVRDVPAGATAGYGGAFVAGRPTRLATLPIGYHDGLRRSVSGRFSVRVRGGWAPVVGVVSMDLTLVDATDSGAEPGDRVIVLGRDGDVDVTAWDLARAASTVPWEVLSTLSPRVPRVYSERGAA